MTTNCQPDGIYSSLAGDEDLADLVEVFVEEVAIRIDTLNQAAQKSDWTLVERYAHQLKGALGSYGFDTVMPLAQDLEMATRQHLPEAKILEALKGLSEMCTKIQAGQPKTLSVTQPSM